MKDDRVYLGHMLECLDWVHSHTADGRDAFFTERKTQSAVIRELQTLAESSTRLSRDITSTHPEVPWDYIGAFRNVVVHDYLGLDLHRIWQIVQQDLPPLRAAILEMQQAVEREFPR